MSAETELPPRQLLELKLARIGRAQRRAAARAPGRRPPGRRRARPVTRLIARRLALAGQAGGPA